MTTSESGDSAGGVPELESAHQQLTGETTETDQLSPYDKHLARLLSRRLRPLDLAGTAEVTTREWKAWSVDEDTLGSPYDKAPVRTRTFSFDEVAQLGLGWQLRMRLSDSAAQIPKVERLLSSLKKQGGITDFAMGLPCLETGFASPGEEEVLVRVGHFAKAEVINDILDKRLGRQLPEATQKNRGYQLFSSILLGRFELGTFDPDFEHKEDLSYPVIGGPRHQWETFLHIVKGNISGVKPEYLERPECKGIAAEWALVHRYGAFFAGSSRAASVLANDLSPPPIVAVQLADSPNPLL